MTKEVNLTAETLENLTHMRTKAQMCLKLFNGEPSIEAYLTKELKKIDSEISKRQETK